MHHSSSMLLIAIKVADIFRTIGIKKLTFTVRHVTKPFALITSTSHKKGNKEIENEQWISPALKNCHCKICLSLTRSIGEVICSVAVHLIIRIFTLIAGKMVLAIVWVKGNATIQLKASVNISCLSEYLTDLRQPSSIYLHRAFYPSANYRHSLTQINRNTETYETNADGFNISKGVDLFHVCSTDVDHLATGKFLHHCAHSRPTTLHTWSKTTIEPKQKRLCVNGRLKWKGMMTKNCLYTWSYHSPSS